MSEIRWAIIHPFQLRVKRGIEVYVWNLARSLKLQGIDVDILTWAGDLEIPEEVQKAGVKVKEIPRVQYYQAIFGIPFLLWWLLTGHYDHVFVHFAGYGEGLALSIARLIKRVKFSIVFHFPRSLVPHRYVEFDKWILDRKAEHLIGVSQATAEEVERWVNRECLVIGHGVDTTKFKPDQILRIRTRTELGIDENAPVLVSVNALEERKGIQWVIKALPELLANLPSLNYIVVGDGVYRSELEHLVEDLNLADQVHFMGTQNDISPYLCAGDLNMVLARGEASSISLLEGLACGLPAVTSSRPPFDELIHEDWGFCVNEEDTSQVVNGVLKLLMDKQALRSMGMAGRQMVIESHNWDSIAGQYIKLIRGVK